MKVLPQHITCIIIFSHVTNLVKYCVQAVILFCVSAVFVGPLPDLSVLSSRAALSQITPTPLMANLLTGITNGSLTDPRFGAVPRGSSVANLAIL